VAGKAAEIPIPGVVVSPNGWVHYEESPQAYLVAESESTRAKIFGKRLPGGGCRFKEQATIPPNALEVVEEEIAYNPKSCESIVEQKFSLRPPTQKAEFGSGAQTQATSSSPSEIQFKSGHTKTQWVDPPGLTITSVNADLTWPVAGPTAGVRGKAYQYAFNWDGWKKSGLKESTVYKVTTQDPNETIMGSKTYNYADGWSFHAHEDFTNTDFYKALVALLGVGSLACTEPGVPAVFHHAVKVTGYRSGQMGYWRETTKKGACNNLVHKVERIGWGIKGPENEKFHPPGGGGILSPIRIPTIRFAALEEEFEIDPDVSPETPYPVDSWIPENQITETSALLEGTIDPEGKGNFYRFECGTTEEYAMWASPTATAGTGSDPVGVSATIPNLTPNTTYHCRLGVLNAQGEAARGPDLAFTTHPVTPTGPVVWTNDAFDIRQKSAILFGVIDPRGKSTRYYFEYGYGTEYGHTFPALPGGDAGSGTDNFYATSEITGLEPEHTYHYRIVASNADGTTYGNDRSFKTLAHIPPDTTTGPASEIRATSARLNAMVNPNGSDTEFWFQYGKASATNFEVYSPGGGVGSGVEWVPVSVQITGLKPGTTYRYYVGAGSSGGGSEGDVLTFTTTGPGVEVLPPGEVTQSKITMSAKVDGLGSPTTYWFEYGNSAAYGFKTEVKSVPAGSGFQPVSAALEGLPVGATIHYRVVATSSEGTNASPDQLATTAWREEPRWAPETDNASEGLQDVSCASAVSCVAVGGYLNRDPWQLRLAASIWDGTNWTPVDPPSLAGYYSELKGVSCTSATSCLAVGVAAGVEAANANLARPLVMKWDGNTWTEVAVPQSPAGVNYYLEDISCPAVNSCEAVGYRANVYHPNASSDARPLVLHWDGSSWTTRVSANPFTPGGEPVNEGSLFDSVSCASATFCKAVGRHYASVGGKGGFKPLIERLSGSEWVTETADTAGYPATETDFWLKGVSCPTTTVCLAVGYSGTSHDEFDPAPKKAFTQRWNGSQWTSYQVPEEAGNVTELYDVSCSSPGFCQAGGNNGRAVHWTGTQWRLQAPKPPPDAYMYKPKLTLNGVSCPTATDCHAVGSYVTNTGGGRLTQGWSGAGAVPRTSGNSATNVVSGTATATLRGSVDPRGVDTKYYFEYGLTEAYGMKTVEVSAGSSATAFGSAWVEGSAVVTGLKLGSTYHFRIVATNGFSSSNGPDSTFFVGAPTNTALPAISLTTVFPGVPMSTTTGSWNWFSSPSFTYQWRRCNAAGAECVNIAGATKSTYTPVEADVAKTLVSQVTATNAEGSTSAYSKPTEAVVPVGQTTEYAGNNFGFIAPGPGGNLWFGSTGKISKMTPAGVITNYPTPSAESFVSGLVTGPEGNIWFGEYRGLTGTSPAHIGKITAAGVITEYTLPNGTEPYGLIVGPDGNIWFTARRSGKIGKITTAGVITEYSISAAASPSGITIGPDGNLWFTEWENKIGKITTAGAMTHYTLPYGSTQVGPLGITTGPDGNLWITGSLINGIVRVNTAGTFLGSYALPAGSEPTGITKGPDGNAWVSNQGSKKIARVTSAGVVTEFPLLVKPRGIVVGAGNYLWFASYYNGKVGKIAP
jgi:streptogramin lyase